MEEIQNMTKEQYESLSAVQLKEIAKSRGLKNLSGLKKSEVIARTKTKTKFRSRQNSRKVKKSLQKGKQKSRDLIFHSLTAVRQ